ncbi:dTDP-4-dehydrorhamnose 3,5-epimerase [Rhizobium sp. KVB221]|uniref:dTDP-4-dehydrorhamnose 3,5-epimerase n=1 Tax=Rhizobium setariae TaxID=2801340 RepID=A0A936YPS2_9HYPH|nr:dTDP-4-dehydrorhamnose 3,5-epimerase [Rhizobium setariae]MBL0372587.1 dTDP-4-dehydrorhamnose 3,5-epimerase [Rhizobium setariae]
MNFERFDIEGPVLVTPKRIGDSRGWFSETFRADAFADNVGPHTFVQHNQSMSAAKGTVRGLHFQLAPMGQGKLVRCLRGAILDVAVDIRRSSPTFGRHVTAELTPDNSRQLWVPEGFAHGFVTLTEDTEIFYLVTNYYSPAHDRGLAWNDPALAIEWGLDEASAQLSDKDRKWPVLAELPDAYI